MKQCKVGQKEYQLQAEIEHEFMMSGATGPAYTSIVAVVPMPVSALYENTATLNRAI